MPLGELLAELDATWNLATSGKVPLRVFGSMALMLQTPYSRGTTDSDILESAGMEPAAKAELERLAGRGTAGARRHGTYIEVVAEALPFLPQQPLWHPVKRYSSLNHFDVTVLDVVDVVVSKLKRFEAKDRDDILAMIDHGLDHAALLRRFRLAVDVYSCDARAEDLPKYVAHLHIVEREYFDREPSEIELPSWI